MLSDGQITEIGNASLGVDISSIIARKPETRAHEADRAMQAPIARESGALELNLSAAESMDVYEALEVDDDLAFNRRRVNFQLDYGTGRGVFRVIDASSQEVIREIPSEEVRRMSQRLSEMLGRFLDREV